MCVNDDAQAFLRLSVRNSLASYKALSSFSTRKLRARRQRRCEGFWDGDSGLHRQAPHPARRPHCGGANGLLGLRKLFPSPVVVLRDCMVCIRIYPFADTCTLFHIVLSFWFFFTKNVRCVRCLCFKTHPHSSLNST